MPRPRASPENLALALDFACVVTTDEGADASSLVARHGPNSIYAVLARCCPGVIRDHTAESNRKGVSEAEFLRTLAEQAMPEQHREFLRFRDRKAVKMSADPTGAGMCVFRNVRWRNPAIPADLKYLRDQHKRLSRKYPVLAENTFESWLATMKSVLARWEGTRHCTLQSARAKSGPTCLLRRSSDASDASDASTSCRLPASPVSPPYDTPAPSPRSIAVPAGCLITRKRGRTWRLDNNKSSAPSPSKAARTPQHPASVASLDEPSATTVFASFTLGGPARPCAPAERPPDDGFAEDGGSAVVGEVKSELHRPTSAEAERRRASTEAQHPDLVYKNHCHDDGLLEMPPLDRDEIVWFVSGSDVDEGSV